MQVRIFEFEKMLPDALERSQADVLRSEVDDDFPIQELLEGQRVGPIHGGVLTGKHGYNISSFRYSSNAARSELLPPTAIPEMPRRPFRAADLPETFVADAAGLADCVAHLRTAKLIGFDTEFVGEETFRPELCLVQISTAERLFVIDPYHCGPMDEFWKLMHDPARTVIVHAGREEVRMCQFFSGKPPAAIFDAQIAIGLIGSTYPISYAGLVQEMLGVRLNKSDTLTEWRRRPLSASQLRYAYDDVRYLIPAFERIRKQLKKLDRLAWADEEFATFIRWALGDDPTVERWRKLKGIGSLGRRELAILQEIFAWRERAAERQNRPLRAVMRDDVLLEVVRAGNRSPEDFQQLRGIPKGELANILEAVRRGRGRPLAGCPDVLTPAHEPPQMQTLTALLSVVLSERCAEMQLAQFLVCSQHHLKDVIRSYSPGGEIPPLSPFLHGWRNEHILPRLKQVLEGKLSIRVADPNNGTPLEFELSPVK